MNAVHTPVAPATTATGAYGGSRCPHDLNLPLP
jgi:hypothetical protein